MDERCEANLLTAFVRLAVGRAVFIIREHAIFLDEGYFIPIIHDFLDAVGVSLLRRRPPPMGVVWIVFILLRSPWPSSLLF